MRVTHWIVLMVLILSVMYSAKGASIEGWVVWGNGGDLYVSDGNSRTKITTISNARNACWSADANYIYVLTDDPSVPNNDIGGENINGKGYMWRVNNDGTDPVNIPGVYYWHGRASIATYRPDDDYAFYVEGHNFYKVDIAGNKETVYNDPQKNYIGEFAISTDGMRIAARSSEGYDVDHLYMIEVNGSRNGYDSHCQSSITPDGQYLSANAGNHEKFNIYRWSNPGSVYKSVSENDDKINSGRFAANSNEHIVYTSDINSYIAVMNISTEETEIFVRNQGWGGLHGPAHPDFWLGDLPDGLVGAKSLPDAARGITAPVWQEYRLYSLSGAFVGTIDSDRQLLSSVRSLGQSVYIMHDGNGTKTMINAPMLKRKAKI
ncbi:MAG: hypothetical protein GF401_15350 [Chitinivibrionales bacterium]|nr:hypothetical protein [Chitinivibrionales bacterium]